MRYRLTILLVVLSVAATAQKIETGTWRTHYAFTYVSRMAAAGDKVYGLADGALMSVDNTGEVRTYSKLTGLNDNEVSYIYSIPGTGKLLVAYNNSNIDIIDADGYIQNINDLYSKSMNSSKQINSAAYKAGRIYLACGFGITSINLSRLEFGDTYMIGQGGNPYPVMDVEIVGDTLFAMTDSCLKFGLLNGPNLMNNQNWNDYDQPAGTNLAMTIFGGNLYLLKNDSSLYVRRCGVWSRLMTDIADVWSDQWCLYVKRNDGRLSVSGAWNDNKLPSDPTAATCDGKCIWYSMYGGLVRLNMHNGEVSYYEVNCPANNFAWRIKSGGDRVFVVPGGRFAINYYRTGFVSWFNGLEWNQFRSDNSLQYYKAGWAYDFVDVAVDPQDKHHFWVASYGVGLSEFRNDQICNVYDCDNSPIETLFPNGDKFNYMRVDGLTYDSEGRLWMTNRGNAQIKCIDRSGNWHLLSHSGLTNATTLQDILIDQNTTTRKYVLCPRYTSSSDSYLFVFDDKGTLDDVSDDETRGFTSMVDQDGKTIYFNDRMLRSIAQDKNGLIWVGTTEGVFNISSRAKIFDSSFRCSRIKISRNDGSGLADYLLGTESINAIAVDGGNRKWFGTDNGVFLVSEDGQETLLHLTTDNSPLTSNIVSSIGINDETGEVFFGTDGGLISYQSDAREGYDDYSEIHAYPNPVRPDYDGLITITGLMEGSHVKICDVNGRTIYETVSNGGVATWNRGDAPSGVYFAMCFNGNKKKGTCKILVLKRE